VGSVPQLQAEIEVIPVDTSSTSQKYLAKLKDGRQFEISETMKQFIGTIDGRRTVEEIAAAFSKTSGRECSALDAERIIQDYLVPHGLVHSENGDPRGSKQRSYLYLRLPIFSQRFLRPVTNVLHVLFTPGFFYAALLFIALFHFYFYFFADRPSFLVNTITGSDVFLVYGLVFLTTLFHELGHSSACHHFGAKHGDIGVGLYLYFPVFYADVSDVWKLKRGERAVVDFAGMYFQLLLIPVLYILYVSSNGQVFLYVIYTLDFSIIASLNPLFRFDGYWLASDLAGVPNLRKRSQETLRYLFLKILRHGSPIPPPNLQVEVKAKYFLYTYALVSNLFFAYFTVRLLIYLPALLQRYPALLWKFFSDLPRETVTLDYAAFLHSLSAIFFPSLTVFMLGMMLYRMLSPLIRPAAKKRIAPKLAARD
jgi:putative peptide zinc metalloprotease protein